MAVSQRKNFNHNPQRRPARGIFIYIIGLMLIAGVALQGKDVRSQQSGNWSDAATWAGGTVPGQGDNVLVDSGHVVVYDVHTSDEIRLVHVRGKLTFSRKVNTRLDVGMLILDPSKEVDVNFPCSAHAHKAVWENAPRPTLEVGTPIQPIPRGVKAEIRLVYFSDMDDDCAPGIISYGGRMDFHGAPMEETWVKMGKTSARGASTITLAKTVDWQVGDHIIVTRSNRPSGNIVSRDSYRVNGMVETEERYITAIAGKRITLDKPLRFSHPVWKNGKHAGEVAVLSRNVVITSKNPDGVRGHTMYHLGSLGSISYAEFSHLGKAGKLARYPIHFHLVRNSMRGSSIIGASIWDSHNRFVTIHGTDYMVVRDCVGYQSLGNGFFMEDATESYNLLENNLAVQAYRTDKLPGQALPFDKNDGAGYWWANGRNAFLNNVANECDTYGFQFDVRPRVRAPITLPDGNVVQNYPINRLSFIKFRNNEAHGTLKYGFWMRGDAIAKQPFVIEDTKIWGLWYSFQPDLNHFYIKNLDIWNVAYGLYGKNPKNGRVENFQAIRPGNHAMSFQDTPEGLITFTEVRIDSSNEYPFKLYGRDRREKSTEIHIKNFTVTNADEDAPGVASTPGAEKHPELTLFLHDWFGPGQDAKVIPAKQHRNDGLTYETLPPTFKADVKVAKTDVPFPDNPIEPIDILPPATVILYPAQLEMLPAGTKTLKVRGTSIDASNIRGVTVNGVAAKALEENYLTWEVTLTGLKDGPLTLTAAAIDADGNKEITAHHINIGIGSQPERKVMKHSGMETSHMMGKH